MSKRRKTRKNRLRLTKEDWDFAEAMVDDHHGDGARMAMVEEHAYIMAGVRADHRREEKKREDAWFAREEAQRVNAEWRNANPTNKEPVRPATPTDWGLSPENL